MQNAKLQWPLVFLLNKDIIWQTCIKLLHQNGLSLKQNASLSITAWLKSGDPDSTEIGKRTHWLDQETISYHYYYFYYLCYSSQLAAVFQVSKQTFYVGKVVVFRGQMPCWTPKPDAKVVKAKV